MVGGALNLAMTLYRVFMVIFESSEHRFRLIHLDDLDHTIHFPFVEFGLSNHFHTIGNIHSNGHAFQYTALLLYFNTNCHKISSN